MKKINEFENLFNNLLSSPTITITKEEAKSGCTKYKAVQVNIVCEQCNGVGDIDGDAKCLCNECGGKGQIVTTKKTFFGAFTNRRNCKHCKGVGRIVDNPCVSCKGTGKVAFPLDVHIPAGTKNDDILIVDTIEFTGNESYVSVRVK